MRKIEHICEVYMTVKELKERINYDICNRSCNSNAKNDKYYSNVSLNRTERRVKKYTNSIFKKNDYEWNEATPMVIHEVGEQNNMWIISDGAGRWNSILNAVEQGIITEEMEIPVRLIHCNETHKMRKDMIDINMHNVNWNGDDILHYSAMNGDDNSKKILAELVELQNELNIKTSAYIPKLIMFGERGSHKDALFLSDFMKNPYAEALKNGFKTVYSKFDERPKKIQNKVRTSNVAIALHGIFCNVLMKLIDKHDNLTPQNEQAFIEICAEIGNIINRCSSVTAMLSGDKTHIKFNIIELISENTQNKILKDVCKSMTEIKRECDYKLYAA